MEVRGALAFAGEGPFNGPAVPSALPAPFETGALSLAGGAEPAFPTVAAVVVAEEDVDGAAPSGFLLPPTSFFHFLTVSFAKSATFLSS